MFLGGFELSFFSLLSYISGYCVIVFLAVSLACGLYYLAELTEEYPAITKKIIQISIYQSAASLVFLFFFDDFPWMETIFTLVGCFLYHKLMQSFPLINFSSPLFIGSMVSFLIQNMMWYYWFDAEEPYREYVALSSSYIFASEYLRLSYSYTLLKIMGFFVPCVWLVPFLLFISLSVNDSVLPTGLPSSDSATQDGKKQSLVKSIFGFFSRKKDSALLHHTASFENYSDKRVM